MEASVVRLYQTALDREPNQTELASATNRIKSSIPLHVIAAELLASREFAALEPSKNAVIAALKNSDSADLVDLVQHSSVRADLLVALAESEKMRHRISLLPALLADASPENADAYRLWIELYEQAEPDGVPQPHVEGGRIVFLLRVGDSTAEEAIATVSSVQSQSYSDWTVILLISDLLSPWTRQAINALCAADLRCLYQPSARGFPAAEAIRAVLKRTKANFIAALSPGDQLAPGALSRIVAEFAKHSAVQALYTDEDVVDETGRHSPRFKSAFSPDLAQCLGGAGDLTVLRAELAKGAARSASSSSPETYANITLTALLTAGCAGVAHLPAVLLHKSAPRRRPPLRSHNVPVATGQPKVSVLIPTRDQAGFLAKCTEGLLKHTAYPALELIIVDNGSTSPDAQALLTTLAAEQRVRVLSQPGGFNFSALNNLAARAASGEVLLLLNNDIEITQAEWLNAMASIAIRPDVGAVGAKLLYPDRTIQHAGIVLGRDGSAIHLGRGAAATAPGYLGQFFCTRDVAAVTGACLAIRKSVFDRVGGMNDNLAVTWNDVDLCLRVRSHGLRVVWTPDAELVHHEGVSRGADMGDQRKRRRFLDEQATMRTIWGNALSEDPFLSPHLRPLENGHLVLTSPQRRPNHKGSEQQ